VISLVDIAKSIGSRVLFENVSFQIGVSERIGLVGPNGSGKTTLLEILAERLEPDRGTLGRNKRASIGYLPQEVPRYADRTLIAEMLAGHEALDLARKRLDLLEEEMAATDDAQALEALSAEYGELERSFAEGGGYDLPGIAGQILGGLGFATDDFERPTAEFSGGWLMRLALGKLLLTRPDLMLLDEPTNYLDLHSVIWLEGYLKSYQGSIIVVSHDRALLNNVAQRILEIDQLTVVSYTGNYDDYMAARVLREEQLEAARRQQEREIKKTQLFIDRFRYKNTKARQVQSRIKLLEKTERIETASAQRSMRLRFPEPARSSRVQIELEEVWKSYGGPPVYTGIDLKIERGERIVLVGPNGAGKSTLMKILGGVLPIDRGTRRVGQGVSIAYFAQHQVDALDYRRSVLDELASAAPDLLNEQLRKLLGRFLFTADDVFKTIGVLSGGEKTRVALAKVLVAAPNLLLLDEPTSHLDIRSRDVLEEALGEYSGTVITISHDRHFIERLSTRVIEAGDGTVRSYLGGYADYVEKKAQQAAEQAAAQAAQNAASAPPEEGNDGGAEAARRGRRTKEDRRREAERRQQKSRRLRPLKQSIATLEGEIEALQGEIDQLEQRMADPGFYEGASGFDETFRDYNAHKAVLASKTERWEELVTELEAMDEDGS
jgi:ATP-binding cassette subfamily F protein 3